MAALRDERIASRERQPSYGQVQDVSSYRDVEKRLAVLEAQAHVAVDPATDFSTWSYDELVAFLARCARIYPAHVAALGCMTDAELEQLAVMSDREAEAYIDRKIREGAA